MHESACVNVNLVSMCACISVRNDIQSNNNIMCCNP